jgi:hypothetical protein
VSLPPTPGDLPRIGGVQYSWRWRTETLAGQPVSVGKLDKVTFASQSDAETWLGETFTELIAAGADQVILCEGDQVVYGPMSLHP